MKSKILIFMAIFLMIAGGLARGEDSMIGEGKTVKFDYTLKVNGEMVDSSQAKGPLEYVHGQGMIIPGLEKQLEGLKVGDERTITVAPEDAYGPIDDTLFREFPKTILAQESSPEVGKMIQLQDRQGNVIPAVIMEIKEEALLLNFNHPLAGQELTFEIAIVAIQ